MKTKRNFPREAVLNQLIRVPVIQRWSNRHGSTGRNNDVAEVQKVYSRLSTLSERVEGMEILELGPGHTFGNLRLANEDGAKRTCAIDVMMYLDAPAGVEFRLYDGTTLPYDDCSFDLVWSWTVLEHLRFPRQSVKEMMRVLRPGGMAVHFVDLVDHFAYRPGPTLDNEVVFDCLRFPEWKWNAMTRNRSTYVNRLRLGDWIAMFAGAGFDVEVVEKTTNNYVSDALSAGEMKFLKGLNVEDAVTQDFLTICRKR